MSRFCCGLVSKRKKIDKARNESSRPIAGGQEKRSRQYSSPTEDESYTNRSGECRPHTGHGDRSRNTSISSTCKPPIQVHRSSAREASVVETVNLCNVRMSPTGKRARLTGSLGSTRSDPLGGKHVIQASSLPDVSKPLSVTRFHSSQDSSKKTAELSEKTNKRKRPEEKKLHALEATLGPKHGQGKEEPIGIHSASLQEENADLRQHIYQLLSSNEEKEKKVQNLGDIKADNTGLMKEVERLLLIEKKGFELIEELQNENKKLNKENMRAVNTVEDLISHSQKCHSQLEYLQRDNDRLKGECDKEKKTVRKLVAEKNKLENTLKELKQVHPLTPEESNKIRISSVPGSQSGILHQIHEYEKQIKAKNTEIKRLQEELEDESVKAQNLLHEREKYNLELTDQRYEFKSVTDKTSKSQLFVDNLQQLLKDAGIPEFGGDLDKCVGHLLAVYQTCRREVERMQKENDKLAQQTDQGREHESSLMSQTTMSSELRDLQQIFQDSQRANSAEFSKLQQNYEEKISSVINEKNELQQIVESQSHLGSQLEMVDGKHAKIQLELEDKNNKLRQCVSDLQSQYQRLELEYNNFRQTSSLQIQERDDKLKHSSIRISKLVAENVGRNNPFLEDLGSQNRSMKIAERFRGDLYGDIWCDTLDLLMDDGMPEEEALKAICDTLLAVYQFCRDHLARIVQCASSFLMNLTDTGLDPSLTGTQELGGDLVHLMSAMKDFLRASAMTVTPDKLLQLYTRRDGTDILPLPEALVGFTRQALAICWCMVTQDPPMSLLHTLDPGGGYDPSSFQAYRSSGIRAKFLVWPALLLTDSGPLMEKGVVFT